MRRGENFRLECQTGLMVQASGVDWSSLGTVKHAFIKLDIVSIRSTSIGSEKFKTKCPEKFQIYSGDLWVKVGVPVNIENSMLYFFGFAYGVNE